MTKSDMRQRPFGATKNENNDNFFARLIKNQRFLAFIGLVLLVLIFFPLLKTYSQKRLIEDEMSQIKEDIARYEVETEQLQEMIEYLGSEASLEAQARMNLNLKKPGETVVVIERDDMQNILIENRDKEVEVSNLKKWKDYFFNPKS